ncbi:hypothetical protein Pssp01_11260 [Pseudomonas sp. NBRC 100443]|nr:hypothetical protein Pssp01_11260 [Pseudomonas sp. NBRC 100443]
MQGFDGPGAFLITSSKPGFHAACSQAYNSCPQRDPRFLCKDVDKPPPPASAPGTDHFLSDPPQATFGLMCSHPSTANQQDNPRRLWATPGVLFTTIGCA